MEKKRLSGLFFCCKFYEFWVVASSKIKKLGISLQKLKKFSIIASKIYALKSRICYYNGGKL